MTAGAKPDPWAQRDRQNAYLFASAIIREGLELLRQMNKTFKDDDEFRNGLGKLLKDKNATNVEKQHLQNARNRAIFHFDGKEFAKILAGATVDECLFLSGKGNKERDVYYAFADVIAAEILVGYASNTEEFYETLEKAMIDTRDLVLKFEQLAKGLIGNYLLKMGFGMAKG